jgi:lipopolysaccharide transport system ATP-binding protein
MSVAIVTEGLSKRYRIGELHGAYGTLRDSLAATLRRVGRRDRRQHYEEIWALRDISLEIREGEVLGVIGHNGAGKSTLLKILTRITTPTTGRAEIRFAGVEQFIDTPVKRYSSGMSVRLAFAVAAHLEPEILLVDEVLAVGDAEFQRRCLGRMDDLGQSGRTIVFVSHQMQAVAQLCERAVLLDHGTVVQDGPSNDIVAQYLQSVGGGGSAHTWHDLESAPGNDIVRMRSVRVVDETGDVVRAVDVRRPVGVEIAFRVLRSDGRAFFPKIKLYDARRNVICNAMDTSRRWREPAPPGDYVATAWIPGNLLNEGVVSVEAGIWSLGTPKMYGHAGAEVVTFHVQDPGEGDSAKGLFTGQWQGVVRPLLEWTTEER